MSPGALPNITVACGALGAQVSFAFPAPILVSLATLPNITVAYSASQGAMGPQGPVGPMGGSAPPSMIDHDISVASNNAKSIKGTAGTVTGWSIFNNSADFKPIYVKLFDKASPPVPGVDPVKLTLAVQAGMPRELALDSALTFATGIARAIVKGIADSDNTPVGAGDCSVDIFFN